MKIGPYACYAVSTLLKKDLIGYSLIKHGLNTVPDSVFQSGQELKKNTQYNIGHIVLNVSPLLFVLAHQMADT